jgi:hypothetical protein
MANQNGFTADDDQVKELLSAQPGWNPQQAIAWANRYYTPVAQPGTLPDPVATKVPQAPGYTQTIPQTGDPNGPQDQGTNSQTYSQTPGAAPTNNTTNQGTQDVLRNTYLQRATQPIGVDRKAANFRQQVDPYAAAQERSKRDYLSQKAEQLSSQGMANSGALQNEQRYASERAGQATGLFESQLVIRELDQQRTDKREALAALSGILSADQTRQLQRDLADLDAALKRETLTQTGSLGSRELDIKNTLGTGALNVDLIRALLQNQQFLTDAGIRIGDLEGRYAPWL